MRDVHQGPTHASQKALPCEVKKHDWPPNCQRKKRALENINEVRKRLKRMGIISRLGLPRQKMLDASWLTLRVKQESARGCLAGRRIYLAGRPARQSAACITASTRGKHKSKQRCVGSPAPSAHVADDLLQLGIDNNLHRGRKGQKDHGRPANGPGDQDGDHHHHPLQQADANHLRACLGPRRG